MTDQVQGNGSSVLSGLPKALLTNSYILVLLAVLGALELYNTGAMPALINREKSVERAAVAENARLREGAEAALAEAKSITAAAIAEHAPKKQAGDARKAKAAAAKAAAEAEIARAEASVSEVRSKGEAEAETALADLTRQQALVEAEKARQANRKLRADTEIQQINLAISKVNSMFSQMKIRICMDCDPTYCVFCQKRFVPDLPSGAELPPAEEGETPAPKPATPVLTVFRSVLPFEAGSQCDLWYKTWSASLAYGAYATGHPGCGYSAGQPDIETARRLAIRDCAWSGCAVIAEITEANAQKPKPAVPPGKPVLTRIHRDPFPLGGGCRGSFDKWSASGAYGAFAVSSRHCGSSTDADTLDSAKQQALARCGDSECYLVYQITAGQAAAAPAGIASAPVTQDAARGKVVPVQLNVHSKPSADAESVIGKLNQGESVVITGTGDGDFIAIEGTCIDGNPCKGFVNGRREFIER